MKSSSFKISQTINVSPEEAWKVIGAVSGVDQWLAPITKCEVEGNRRTCTTAEGSFDEEIVQVNHEEMVLDYLIPKQHMIPVENIKGQMAVKDAEDGKTNITWMWEFDVEDANMETARGAFEMIGNMGIKGIESFITEEVA